MNRNTDLSGGFISQLLTPIETADRLGLSLSTLAKMRMRGDNLAFVKLHGAVRYRDEDIKEYIQASLRGSTSDSAPER